MYTLKIMSSLFQFITIIIAVLGLKLYFRFYHETSRHGFYCHDLSLSYPHREQSFFLKDLNIFMFGIPLVVVLADNLIKLNKNHNLTLFQRSRRFLIIYGYFLFGFELAVIGTEIPKRALGHMRPHFFEVCQPQLADGTTCDDEVNHYQFIEEYTCTGHEKALPSVIQSFPSGHATYIFYSMLFTAIYMQQNFCMRGFLVLHKFFLQFLLLMFALHVSLKGIDEHFHHAVDVFAGGIIGCGIAIWMMLCISKNSQCEKETPFREFNGLKEKRSKSEDREILMPLNEIDF